MNKENPHGALQDKSASRVLGSGGSQHSAICGSVSRSHRSTFRQVRFLKIRISRATQYQWSANFMILTIAEGDIKWGQTVSRFKENGS